MDTLSIYVYLLVGGLEIFDFHSDFHKKFFDFDLVPFRETAYFPT